VSLPPLGRQRKRDSGLWRFAFGEWKGMRIRPQSLLEEEKKGERNPASPSRDTAPGFAKHFGRSWNAYENRIPKLTIARGIRFG